jgi:hypothetical protein
MMTCSGTNFQDVQIDANLPPLSASFLNQLCRLKMKQIKDTLPADVLENCVALGHGVPIGINQVPVKVGEWEQSETRKTGGSEFVES